MINSCQLEDDALLISLIYFQRILASLSGKLELSAHTFKAVIFVSILISTKMWDDLSMMASDGAL